MTTFHPRHIDGLRRLDLLPRHAVVVFAGQGEGCCASSERGRQIGRLGQPGAPFLAGRYLQGGGAGRAWRDAAGGRLALHESSCCETLWQ